ncbi:MAG: hypothetical protein ACJAX5_001318 [Patiriisocius sp.]|jgi:hypothetical protein
MHLSKLVLALSLLLVGCEKIPETISERKLAPIDRSQMLQIAVHLKRHATSNGVELTQEVTALREATMQFLERPDDQARSKLQLRWRSAHEAYARAQFGFLTTNEERRQLIFRIDAWPAQPGFIDDLPLYPESGIINDETLLLSPDVLMHQHGITDDEEVALGFHSMEYLIFARPLADFSQQSNQTRIKRRRQFLAIVADQLVKDTYSIVEACAGQFDAVDYPEALNLLKQVLTGNLQKLRLAFRESNLVTTNDSGHSTFSGTSLLTLKSEIASLEAFMVTAVPMEAILKTIDPNAYANFRATLLELDQLLKDSDQNEVSRANLPLLLSALIHQLESFDRMLIHQLPAS